MHPRPSAPGRAYGRRPDLDATTALNPAKEFARPHVSRHSLERNPAGDPLGATSPSGLLFGYLARALGASHPRVAAGYGQSPIRDR